MGRMPSPFRRAVARTVLILTVAAIATSRLAADTYPRQPGVRIAGYTFDITLSDANDEFVVIETVEVQFVTAGVTTIELDLCKFSAQPRSGRMANGFADPCAEPVGGRGGAATSPKGGKGMTVTGVAAGGQALTYQHENDRVRVTMPRAFKPGESFTFTVNYHGVPATGILVGNNRHGDRSFVSNSWPDKSRNYRATIDHVAMKAPVTHVITAPAQYQVVSNGRLMEQTDLANKLRRTVWKESVPISPWLMSLAVAPFAVDRIGDYRGIPLWSWTYPQEREAGLNAFRAHTQPVLEFFIDRIGPYSYEKLAQVQANGVGGGMELASSIFYGYGPAGPGRQLIAHEMAHQWFGDAVTESDWDDVWLSEGFATYFALLYTEFRDGRDAFLEGVRRSKAAAVNYAIANPSSTIVHDNLADISRVIANNAQIYQGGAQVLHNIRGVIGTDTFWSGIRLYHGRFKDSTATTDDLRRAFEEACASAGNRCPAGGRDLTWLFRQLLNRGGALQVNGTWRYDAGSKQLQVTLEQTQTTGLYRMPIEVQVTVTTTAPAGGRGSAAPQPASVTHIALITDTQHTFTWPCETEPVSVVLDPNAWVVMRSSLRQLGTQH
jgi:aminopeptidase N